MWPNLVKSLLPLLLILPIKGTELEENGSISELRQPKANRRIVRLYSGTRPKPIVCTGEGFQADPTDCTIFHRCMRNGNGRYVSFKFQCGPGTIYDPETEICNHPERTKRTNCGGNHPIDIPNIELSFDNEISKEIPSPISTSDPFNIHSSFTTNIFAATTSHIFSDSSLSTANPWAFHSSKRQGQKTTKTIPTKRHVNNEQSLSSSIPPSWLSPHKPITSTLRSVTRQTTSDTGDICTSDGFMGDSENCRKFYRCINNQRGGFIRYEFMCSEPTIWDEDKQACNHAWSVKRRRCGRGNLIDESDILKTNIQRNVVQTENNLSKEQPSSAQSQLQINYGSKVTQTQTQISNGSVIQNQTQINYGQGFDESKKRSDITQNQTQISHGAATSQIQTQINYGNKAVQTQLQVDHTNQSSQSQSQISESTSTTRSTQHHDAQLNSNNQCTESGFMGDSEDCKKFYRCVDNGRGGFIRYEFSCGEGTVWDPKVEACNHAWAVKDCGGKASVGSTQSTVKTTEGSSRPPESTSSVITSTTTSHYYSSTEDEIDEDNNISYGNQPSTSTKVPQQQTDTPKAPQNPNTNDCKSSGFMGDTSDCKKFYRCVDNGNGGYNRYEFSCGEGTVWDQKIEACNHAWAVENCSGSTNSSVQTTTTSMPITSKQPNNDYDTGYGSQNEQSYYTSSSTTTTEKTSTTTTQSTNTGNDCTSSGFMGDNNDCKKFYRCVDNGNGGYTRYEFSCGDGTVWDPKIQACNHAWAVEKCGGNNVEDINIVETTTRKDIKTTTTLASSMTTQQLDDNNDVGYGQSTREPQPSQQSTSRPQNQENHKNECKSSGFMGDENDCKKFYRCVDNGDGTYTRYEFNCGEGTVWDSKIEACNHAWAVEKCVGTSSKPTTQPSQNNSYDGENISGYPSQSDEYQTSSTTTSRTTLPVVSNTDNSCKTSGFMADNMDCKRFYRCVDNGKGGFIKYEFSCGEGTVWDQTTEACNHDWAVKGQCSQSGHIESNTGSPSTQSSSTESGKDPTNQENVQSSTLKPFTSRPTTRPTQNQCAQEGFYGDENNCKNFYRCVDNGQGGFTKYEFTCGEGTVWNQDIQVCDHASADNKCTSYVSTTSTPSNENDEMINESTTKGPSSSTDSDSMNTSRKPPISNEKCQSEGFYGDASNCKKFYRCVDDGKGGFTKYDFTCGDGTIWDHEILACNHETNDKKCTTHIENSSTTTGNPEYDNSTHGQEQQTTGQPQVTNTVSGEDQCQMEGFFGNTQNCKKFYRCVDNGKGGYIKYDFSCGEGTVWVQEIQACDYDNDISSCSNKESAKPQEQQQPQTTTATSSNNQHTTQSSIPDKENDEYPSSNSSKPPEDETCKSDGFFGYKNDCTRFYRCVDNGQGGYTKYDFTCGEGTAWDSNIQTCNHKNEVENCNTEGQESQSKPVNDEQTSESSGSTSTTKSSSSTESSKPSNTDKCEEEGYFGNTKDCTKFYRCVDNGKGGYTRYDFTCGEGTIWDQDLTTCNHPQDVVNLSCSNDANTETSSENTSTTQSQGSSSSSTTSQSSQGTTESNNQGSSNCTEESSSKKPSDQKIKCEKAGFYPDPNDCKKFYRCVDWDGNGEKFSVFHFDCGEGTIWDPQLETCNHEDSVYPPRDCSGTQSQNETMSQETTTTEKSTTSDDSSTTENTNTQSTTEESTSTPQATSSEQTTQQSTTEKTTTTQQTSSEQTTQQSSTEKTTTQQTTSEQTTTESTKTTQEQTTQESTTTTEQSTSSEQTTSSEKTTTQQSTTSEQTTTQQSTTSEQTTTQQSTTSEQTTTQQSTTSEQTTAQQSTTSEQTTSQQSTTSEQTTTQQSSNTDDTTTESTTTEQTTTTTTEQSTTEETTGQQASTTESSTSTTESSEGTTAEGEQSTTSQETSDKECPETEDDQYMYVCPTSFRRHPKYCNMFYQCTEDDDSHEVKIATFKCPNNTIYDESKTQCVEEDKADKKCNGQIARKHRVKRRDANYKEPIEASRIQHTCDSVGYYPFEMGNECSGGFLKCQKSKSGKLRGYVHRCPDGYTFWSISKRCERVEIMKGCKQSANIWRDRWEIPMEKKNIAQ